LAASCSAVAVGSLRDQLLGRPFPAGIRPRYEHEGLVEVVADTAGLGDEIADGDLARIGKILNQCRVDPLPDPVVKPEPGVVDKDQRQRGDRN